MAFIKVSEILIQVSIVAVISFREQTHLNLDFGRYVTVELFSLWMREKDAVDEHSDFETHWKCH